MYCPQCGEQGRKFGKDRNGNQRYRCPGCKRTFLEERVRPLGKMSLSMEKAEFCLRLLLEGTSIRAVERLTDVNRNTLLSLIVTVGANCERFLEATIKHVPAQEVECDEVWGFVGAKQRTCEAKGYGGELGDAYCFVGIERETKLVLAWHLGKRSSDDCWKFTHKLYVAAAGRYQISTDGYRPYGQAIPLTYRFGVDFAQIIKTFGGVNGDDQRLYSPAQIVGVKQTYGCGNPNPDRVSTSHVERWNLSLRMQVRRMTRLTNAHSKKWENHKAMLALFFAWYNFVRPHSSLGKQTPAQAHGLTDHRWTIEELLTAAAEIPESATQL